MKATPEMDAELIGVARAGEQPMTALQATLDSVVQRSGQSARGWVLETNDLDRVEVPDVLLAAGPMSLMVGITHHRAEGAAWGQYSDRDRDVTRQRSYGHPVVGVQSSTTSSDTPSIQTSP